MKRNVNQNRMIRVLAASLWLAGIAVYPLQGEAALPTHPQSDSTIVGNAPIGSRHETVKIRVVRPQTGRGKQAGDTVGRISRGQTSMGAAWQERRNDNKAFQYYGVYRSRTPGTDDPAAYPDPAGFPTGIRRVCGIRIPPGNHGR